ncbi:MAG: sodium/proline symporter [Enterobacterales bacterium]|nr:sodium/proline symporter [Enterobacterales bacterium]
MMIISFLVCLSFFLGIGLLSARKKQNTAADYLLASRSLSPWLCGLSAVATTNSGFMFTAWIGMTYTLGFSSIWFLLGLGLGSVFVLYTTSKQIRRVSEKVDTYSYGGLISHWQGSEMPILRHVLGWAILIFLSTYAAAQLTASSKAMHVLFGWDLSTGIYLGSIVIVMYCFAGGFRASVWTDVAQSIVMIFAMFLLAWVALDEIGGFASLYDTLEAIDPNLVGILPSLQLAPIIYIVGWFLGGIGITGQPHIMVRFMAVNSEENAGRSLYWYFGWYFAFFFVSWVVGLCARALLPEVANFDSELALPTIAQEQLPQILVGLILAGLFAAAISTADSLVLSASAALSRDIFKKPSASMFITKGSTILISALVLVISLSGNKSVLMLVALAWSILATAITPLLYLFITKQPVPEWLALTMITVGCSVAIGWYFSGLDSLIWPSFPGFIAVAIVYGIYRLTSPKQSSGTPH